MRLFSDQQRLLLASFQDVGTTLGQQLAPEAIATAYREIAGCLPWMYLRRRTQVNTNPPQSAGTMAYNASTNVMTLTGATFPSWATQSILLVNSEVYAIQNVLTSTTASLIPGRAPYANIASGTAYSLMQVEYPLPVDYVRTEALVIIGLVWTTFEMTPADMLFQQRLFYTPQRPRWFTVRGSNYFGGRMSIEFSPPPDLNYTYDIAYYAMPRQRTLSQPYSAGTISCSGQAVTGTGTNFTQAMVGCRLRQGTADCTPVGEYGPQGSTYENTIQQVISPTSLLLADAGNTCSNVQYIIDDPIDVERVSMGEVFDRMCEYQLATLLRHTTVDNKYRAMVQSLQNARARDSRAMPNNQWGSNIPPYGLLEGLAYAGVGGH
jgi:hypothetical protein